MTQLSRTPTPYHRNIKPASKYTTIWAGRNEHIAYMAVENRNTEQVEADMDFILRACNAHDGLVAALKILLVGYGYSSYPSEEEKQKDPDIIFAKEALAKAKAGA